ncbi:MAG TPA: sulfatase [Cyclobacteriaceae bacterium]|jgi:arylsulfatase A-like enzyme|nr:sulfatase [Cyclobacteriaceae bacterium]
MKPLSILSLVFFVNLLNSSAIAQTKTKQPNIIWIITEDMSLELGCYGDPTVKTPNLDKLAAKGTRYTNTFATAPVCSASRSALITAMYQTSIDAQNHRSHRDDGYALPEPIKPITEYLKNAGYYTVLGELKEDGIKGYGKTDYNFNLDKTIFDSNDWKGRKQDQPFFAELMVSVTHRGPVWKTDVQKHEPQIDPAKVILPPFYPDHPIAREDWATYLESIQLMDTYVGTILKRIDDENLTDNTVIIFTSDHGRCMVRDKQFIYDGGIQIPFIMRWPGQIKEGQVNSDLISAIDISATILQIAGIALPDYIEGRSFLGKDVKKRDYIIAARDRMDETVDKMRCVRTKQFKYIKNYMPERPYMQANNYKETEYPVWNLLKELNAQGKLTPAQALFVAPTKPPEEFYDIVADPYELNNLYKDPKYQKQLAAMRKTLEAWIIDTGDQGQFPEKEIWLPKKAAE